MQGKCLFDDPHRSWLLPSTVFERELSGESFLYTDFLPFTHLLSPIRCFWVRNSRIRTSKSRNQSLRITEERPPKRRIPWYRNNSLDISLSKKVLGSSQLPCGSPNEHFACIRREGSFFEILSEISSYSQNLFHLPENVGKYSKLVDGSKFVVQSPGYF